jgi:tetratricopeptide (TPR) repeat protein
VGFSLHAGAHSSTPSIEISLEDALGLAARWIVANHTDEARQLLDGLDTAHPDDPKILFLKGALALIRAEYGEAVRLFRRILWRDPDLTRMRLWLARELFLARDFDAARYHFEIALGQGKHLPLPARDPGADLLVHGRRSFRPGLQSDLCDQGRDRQSFRADH